MKQVSRKTVPENWDSKAPSAGTILAYLDHIFFSMNKTFLFLKIEN
jgi:hypothetical protein